MLAEREPLLSLGLRQPCQFQTQNFPFNSLSDAEVVKRYRLSWPAIQELLQLVVKDLEPQTMCTGAFREGHSILHLVGISMRTWDEPTQFIPHTEAGVGGSSTIHTLLHSFIPLHPIVSGWLPSDCTHVPIAPPHYREEVEDYTTLPFMKPSSWV